MSNQIPVHDVTPAKNANNSVDLYASREKIYTRAFTGLFRNLRMMGAVSYTHLTLPTILLV